MKLEKYGGVMAAAVFLLAVCLMFACFAGGEAGYAALTALPSAGSAAGAGDREQEGRINVNTATAEELEALPGIGPVKAAAIVAWRTENGPFRYPEELSLVSGIGEKTLEGILDQITVGGG